MLTLSHQHRHKVAELRVEPATVRSRLYQRILHTILRYRLERETDENVKYRKVEDGYPFSREALLTVSMGHVTVRIHGKARNFLYCRPET